MLALVATIYIASVYLRRLLHLSFIYQLLLAFLKLE